MTLEKTAENIRTALGGITEQLTVRGYRECCENCGREAALEHYRMGNEYQLLCSDCFSKKERRYPTGAKRKALKEETVIGGRDRGAVWFACRCSGHRASRAAWVCFRIIRHSHGILCVKRVPASRKPYQQEGDRDQLPGNCAYGICSRPVRLVPVLFAVVRRRG